VVTDLVFFSSGEHWLAAGGIKADFGAAVSWACSSAEFCLLSAPLSIVTAPQNTASVHRHLSEQQHAHGKKRVLLKELDNSPRYVGTPPDVLCSYKYSRAPFTHYVNLPMQRSQQLWGRWPPFQSCLAQHALHLFIVAKRTLQSTLYLWREPIEKNATHGVWRSSNSTSLQRQECHLGCNVAPAGQLCRVQPASNVAGPSQGWLCMIYHALLKRSTSTYRLVTTHPQQ
jgi:hypothetical protein